MLTEFNDFDAQLQAEDVYENENQDTHCEACGEHHINCECKHEEFLSWSQIDTSTD